MRVAHDQLMVVPALARITWGWSGGMVTGNVTLTLQLGGEYSRLTTPGNSERNIRGRSLAPDQFQRQQWTLEQHAAGQQVAGLAEPGDLPPDRQGAADSGRSSAVLAARRHSRKRTLNRFRSKFPVIMVVIRNFLLIAAVEASV
ncbi:MAG: hypothetical protein D1H97_20215 [Paracoccus sp. BP8]|nr:MAG: hypothetical protein D1H97_20215 [Paracoccus sp. BP8]